MVVKHVEIFAVALTRPRLRQRQRRLARRFENLEDVMQFRMVLGYGLRVEGSRFGIVGPGLSYSTKFMGFRAYESNLLRFRPRLYI